MSNARITIVRQWPDGDALKVTVSIDANYPDAVAEARATAKRAFAEACDVVLDDDTEPDALPDLPAEVVLPERLDRTRDEDE